MRPKFFVLSVSLFLFSCKDKQETIKPTIKTITESVYASGIVISQNQYKVFSTVSGIVQQVLVEENDTVKIGSPLFVIVNETQQLMEKNAQLSQHYSAMSFNNGKIQEAKSVINLARKKMQNDELMYKRQLNLWQQGIGSKVDLEQKEFAMSNAKTSFNTSLQKLNDLEKQLSFSAQQAQNNLKISNQNTDDYTVKSTINGKVYQININKGEIITPQASLAIIGDGNSYLLEMQVDEYDIVSIKTGMEVMVVLNSYKDTVFKAIVSKINPIMNVQSKTFTIEARFINLPNTLYPSISFEANILIKTKKNAVLIPRNYLQNDSIVFLKNGKQKVVKTGLKDFQMIEIVSGISIDDELIMPQ